MRIALVSEHASPLAVLGVTDAGGQNVYVAELARALAAAGAEVVVHTRRDDPALPDRVELAPGIVVDHVRAGPAEPLPKDELLPHMGAFAAELARRWRAWRPDVVHAHFWMSGLAAADAGGALDIPVLLTFHASGAEKRLQQGARDTSPPERVALERALASSVDRVVATTRHERERLLAAGATPERVVVIPCGVDRDRFNPCGPPWPPSTGRPRVVVVSRLVERKGIGNVITALADVPGAELLIAGGPPEGLLEDDPEARRLAAVAERAGVRDRVELLGAVDRGRVPSLLRSADVVACCPWYEPFGLVAVEAMACGRPVVATEVGGLAETVVDGETGLLVPPRRPDHIAAALRRLVDDPDAVQRMGANGTVRARHYAWDRIAAVLLAEMGTVVAERRRGRARLTVSEEDR